MKTSFLHPICYFIVFSLIRKTRSLLQEKLKLLHIFIVSANKTLFPLQFCFGFLSSAFSPHTPQVDPSEENLTEQTSNVIRTESKSQVKDNQKTREWRRQAGSIVSCSQVLLPTCCCPTGCHQHLLRPQALYRPQQWVYSPESSSYLLLS